MPSAMSQMKSQSLSRHTLPLSHEAAAWLGASLQAPSRNPARAPQKQQAHSPDTCLRCTFTRITQSLGDGSHGAGWRGARGAGVCALDKVREGGNNAGRVFTE